MIQQQAPVITIDGPSGTGKGTLCHLLAQELAWPLLDSGAIYRAIAWQVIQQDLSVADEEAIASLAQKLSIEIVTDPRLPPYVSCNGKDITQVIRHQSCSKVASQIAVFKKVRSAVLAFQRSFRRWPGLLADGRDMGTIVFPDANVKIFLTASLEVRAQRRYRQLVVNQPQLSCSEVQKDLAERDRRDQARQVAPAEPAGDARIIDTSDLAITEVFKEVLDYIRSIIH